MSRDALSQYDIDHLLEEGDGDASRPGNPVDVQVYDFRRPVRVSKERLRTLEAMYERLVKNLEGWVIARVRGQLEVRLQSIELFSFGEFTLSLPSPCSSFVFEIAGTGQKGVIDIGPEVGFFVVDRVFGGPGQISLPNRSLTPIERMAIRTMAERTAQLTEEIWQDHVPMKLAITGFESSPEILQVANREDPVLVANIEVTVGGLSGLVLICLPFTVLDKFFTSTGQQRLALLHSSETEREAAQQKVEGAVREMPVEVSVRLPRFEVTFEDLMQLRVGSIIPTGIPKDAKLVIRTSGQERFLGQAGRMSGMLAVRVTDSLTPQVP